MEVGRDVAAILIFNEAFVSVKLEDQVENLLKAR